MSCIDLCLDRYHIDKKYLRNGKSCYFDPSRQILILETPEELIRQKVLLYLQDKMLVPLDKIEVEIPMSHFKDRAQGRADIIVYGKDEEDILRPILVIECKAPHIPLTDDVFQQVARYNMVLNADTLMITNGLSTEFWSWDYENEHYRELSAVPSYNDLVNKQNLIFDNSPKTYWSRPSFRSLSSAATVQHFFDYGWLGEGTPRSLYHFLMNLGGFIQDDSKLLQAQSLDGINIIEDGGIRYTTFGNAAGGSWTGSYRYFIIEDTDGNNQIISFATFGSLKCENHPKFGNRRGHTTLVVAIDDYDKRHNALQLNLDDYTSVSGSQVTLWHDGKITIGKSGAAKRSELIDFIKSYAPELLDCHGRVLLGTFDDSKEISWNQIETKKFIGRLLKYAIVRDAFRKVKMS